MSFTDYLQVPELAERYRKVKKYFFLRESAYDVTSTCQLRCEGCYYFEGDKYKTRDNRDPEAWRAFFEDEKRRGITYVVLAGAEPALVPKVLQACYDVIPFGSIASNGLKKIDPAVRYRLHLSVWGNSEGDPKYRRWANGKPGPDCLPSQLRNYRDDDRVIFVYTFNDDNVDQLDDVVERIHDEGHKLTFNVFSTPQRDRSPLQLSEGLKRTRDKMLQALDEHPDTVIYSRYNAEVHTQPAGLHELFGCIYPRAQLMYGTVGSGITTTFRSYRTDLTHTAASDCCVPDTDCSDCRHYAAGSAIVSSRLALHVDSEARFRCWLDYVDTYLAVWVTGYQKGPDLYREPAGHAFERAPQPPVRTMA
jgi:organic radical activating enzyme